MLPDPELMVKVEKALDECLSVWSPVAVREEVSNHKLMHYLTDRLDRTEQSDDAKQSPAVCWRVSADGRTARHYLVASIKDTRLSEGEFPEILSCAARLRSHLSIAEQLEVVILLLWQPHKGEVRDVPGFLRVERNESIARVLVWHVESDTIAQEAGVKELVSRLHLTGPLSAEDSMIMDLSPAVAIFTGSNLTPDQVAIWRHLLSRAELSNKDRAEALVAAIDRLKDEPIGT